MRLTPFLLCMILLACNNIPNPNDPRLQDEQIMLQLPPPQPATPTTFIDIVINDSATIYVEDRVVELAQLDSVIDQQLMAYDHTKPGIKLMPMPHITYSLVSRIMDIAQEKDLQIVIESIPGN